jgi:hypothetical protein
VSRSRTHIPFERGDDQDLVIQTEDSGHRALALRSGLVVLELPAMRCGRDDLTPHEAPGCEFNRRRIRKAETAPQMLRGSRVGTNTVVIVPTRGISP